jgi:ClpP class serine protease
MNFVSFIWLFFLISALTPMLQQRWVESQRLRMIRRLEQQRKSRVITLIHRQDSVSFLGIPIARYINVDDSEALLRAIRMTPDDMPIDLVVHTPGGLVLASEQIALALIAHKAPVTVMVPHYAMSGGTLVAMAADRIVMDPNAVLGPVDPQVGEYPAAGILEAVGAKPAEKLEDRTLILASIARRAMAEVRETVVRVLSGNGMPREKAEGVADALATGRFTHDRPIRLEQARELGLPVDDAMPKEVYLLMDLYPQPTKRQPSVQYIPFPYGPSSPAGPGGRPAGNSSREGRGA